ncbi:hypothetical protein GGI00_001920 [Coemansia sp. RSA 2681]|nr:hypothetical protein GGI00_001920 [Coemansia sp. RSA 2681]
MADYTIDGASPEQNKLLTSIAEHFAITPALLTTVSSNVYDYLKTGQQNPTSTWLSTITTDIADKIRDATKQQKVGLGLSINTEGRRLKIASIKFTPRGQADAINKQVFFFDAKQNVMTPGQLLEDIAGRVAEFVNSHELAGPLPLGVTIDWPVEEMAGGGKVAGGLFAGVDIGLALNAVLMKLHLPVRVTSTINCVVSTLVTAQHRLHNTRVALILNHGINASYYEWQEGGGGGEGGNGRRVAVNTELAHFKSPALPLTQWDHRVDRESVTPGSHRFEKLVADKYLGEIVRNLVTDFMDAQLIFQKNADASVFSEPYSFFTSYMTIVEDKTRDLREVGELLKAGFNINASLVDRQIVSALCHIVSVRAAKLVGAAVAGVVRRADEAAKEEEGDDSSPAVVSISGQLTEMNQPYVQCTTETAQALIADLGLPQPAFTVLGEDGYTVGAALSSFT